MLLSNKMKLLDFCGSMEFDTNLVALYRWQAYSTVSKNLPWLSQRKFGKEITALLITDKTYSILNVKKRAVW